MGHSTGGLIISLWAHARRDAGVVDGLVPQQPVLRPQRPLGGAPTPRGRRLPAGPPARRTASCRSALGTVYGESMHAEHRGEWTLRPGLEAARRVPGPGRLAQRDPHAASGSCAPGWTSRCRCCWPARPAASGAPSGTTRPPWPTRCWTSSTWSAGRPGSAGTSPSPASTAACTTSRSPAPPYARRSSTRSAGGPRRSSAPGPRPRPTPPRRATPKPDATAPGSARREPASGRRPAPRRGRLTRPSPAPASAAAASAAPGGTRAARIRSKVATGCPPAPGQHQTQAVQPNSPVGVDLHAEDRCADVAGGQLGGDPDGVPVPDDPFDRHLQRPRPVVATPSASTKAEPGSAPIRATTSGPAAIASGTGWVRHRQPPLGRVLVQPVGGQDRHADIGEMPPARRDLGGGHASGATSAGSVTLGRRPSSPPGRTGQIVGGQQVLPRLPTVGPVEEGGAEAPVLGRRPRTGRMARPTSWQSSEATSFSVSGSSSTSRGYGPPPGRPRRNPDADRPPFRATLIGDAARGHPFPRLPGGAAVPSWRDTHATRP